jgi:hypothetical protein
MSLTLTKHEIASSRGPMADHSVSGWRTAPGRKAFIANFRKGHDDSWRVFDTKRGIDAHWKGDYKTADDALAALQNEY